MSTVKPQKTSSFLTPILLLFILAMVLANIGGIMYYPLESLYLKDLGANISQIGLFFTLSQIVPLLLQILGGWVSDSFGRLKAIAIGSVVGIFVYIPLILATSWEWVLVASALGSITRSLVGPSFDAFIADHSAPKNRARLFGITQTLFSIVSVVGPLLGGFMVDAVGFKVMLMVAAMFYISATVIRVLMAREASKSQDGKAINLSFSSLKADLGAMFALILAGGLFTWIMITDGVRDIFFNMSFSFLSIYMKDIAILNISQIGLMNSIFGISSMAVMIPAGVLADKVGERVNIVIAFILWSIGIALMALVAPASPIWIYGLGWVFAGIGEGLALPAYQSLISKSVPPRLRGVAFGLFSTSLGLVSLPGPLIGSFLWENFSPQTPFLLTAIISLLTIVPVWRFFKVPDEQTET